MLQNKIGSYFFLAAYPPMEYLDSGITHAFLRSVIVLSYISKNINHLRKHSGISLLT